MNKTPSDFCKSPQFHACLPIQIQYNSGTALVYNIFDYHVSQTEHMTYLTYHKDVEQIALENIRI